jgi:hypothetical protein
MGRVVKSPRQIGTAGLHAACCPAPFACLFGWYVSGLYSSARAPDCAGAYFIVELFAQKCVTGRAETYRRVTSFCGEPRPLIPSIDLGVATFRRRPRYMQNKHLAPRAAVQWRPKSGICGYPRVLLKSDGQFTLLRHRRQSGRQSLQAWGNQASILQLNGRRKVATPN